MAISQYDPETGIYKPAAAPAATSKASGAVSRAVSLVSGGRSPVENPLYGQEGQPGGEGGSLYSNWQDPYKQILAGMQAGGGGGGDGGASQIQKQELPEFDKQYTDYRTGMYGQMDALAANPAGYSPEELAMVQQQALDKLYSTVAGSKMGAISDANKAGYLNTGRADQALAEIDRNALSGSASALQGIALQDLENKRQGKYKTAELGQAWASQMGGEQAGQQGTKISLEKDYQDRLDAARRSAAAAGSAHANDILEMQMKIAGLGIQQQQYDDQFALQLMAAENGFGQDYAGLEQASYASNPNYTGERSVW